jgi:NAD(P)-dependent dehydrogenase (short-subunit alcohol dehydrogenase family)
MSIFCFFISHRKLRQSAHAVLGLKDASWSGAAPTLPYEKLELLYRNCPDYHSKQIAQMLVDEESESILMNIDFKDRKVLITGSTAGIGFATARAFVASGATVVINGRDERRVAKAVSELGDSSRASGFAGDLGTKSGCDELLAHHPSFDILINNLGVFGPQDFFETPDSEWERFFQTNVMSGVRLARAYVPSMISRGWGRVVFVSSESAINIPQDMIHYGFTKTAQLAVSRGLAKRLAGTGVTVNAVLPGPTMSDGVVSMLQPEAQRAGVTVEKAADAFIRAHRSSSIIQRAATVDEVANMIIYTSSEQASATTGAPLRVDGGVVDSIA